MATIVFKCPLCGGPFEFAEGDRASECQFCGATSAIVGDSGIHRLLLPERIDLNGARSALRKLLAAEGGREFAASFDFKSGRLYFLPFWRVRGRAVGWQWCEKESWSEEVYYDENGARCTRRVKEPNQRDFSVISKPVDFSSPAAAYDAFGPLRAGLAGTVLKCEVMDYPLAAARGVVADPFKGAAQARHEALAMLLQGATPEGLLRRESRQRITGEWLSLMYYPVWSLQFSRGEILYPVTVDAISGDVTRCRFALEKEPELFLPLALIALLLYGWTTVPVVGLLMTALSVALLKWRVGTVELPVLVRLLAGIPRRDQEVRRG